METGILEFEKEKKEVAKERNVVMRRTLSAGPFHSSTMVSSKPSSEKCRQTDHFTLCYAFTAD